jgi:hypothetical protein
MHLPHYDSAGFRRAALDTGRAHGRVGLDLAEAAGRLAGRVLGELAPGDSHEPGHGPLEVARHDEPSSAEGHHDDVAGGNRAGADQVGAEPEALDKVCVGGEPVEIRDDVPDSVIPVGGLMVASSAGFAFKALRVAVAAIVRPARVAATAVSARSPLKEGPAKIWDAAWTAGRDDGENGHDYSKAGARQTTKVVIR